MNIDLQPAALTKLLDHVHTNERLRVGYDSSGCGCAVNGVPVLWIESQSNNDPYVTLQELSSNVSFPVVMDVLHSVYYEEYLMLEANSDGTFKLYGRQQTYSTHVPLKRLNCE